MKFDQICTIAGTFTIIRHSLRTEIDKFASIKTNTCGLWMALI